MRAWGEGWGFSGGRFVGLKVNFMQNIIWLNFISSNLISMCI